MINTSTAILEKIVMNPWVDIWTSGGVFKQYPHHNGRDYSGDSVIKTKTAFFWLGCVEGASTEIADGFRLHAEEVDPSTMIKCNPPLRPVNQKENDIGCSPFFGPRKKSGKVYFASPDADDIVCFQIETAGYRLAWLPDLGLPESLVLTDEPERVAKVSSVDLGSMRVLNL